MNKYYEMIKKIFLRVFNYAVFYLITPFLLIKGIEKNKIVVSNFWGRGYGDNPKYIVDYLIAEKAEVKIVWLCSDETLIKNQAEFPDEINLVKNNSLEALIELFTAKIWIDNSRKNFHPIKRKKQFYLQTWHAGFGLKRIEHDIEDSLSKLYIKIAKKDSKMCDLLVFEHSDIFKDLNYTFWYDGEFYREGIPKNDIIVNYDDSVVKKVYQDFGVKPEKKILLYAPTFRENEEIRISLEELLELKLAFEVRFQAEYVVFLRLHPNDVKKNPQLLQSIGKFDWLVDANYYGDMQKLLCATDTLITDYSSTFGEMLIANKKCFLYTYDYDSYMEGRGMMLDLHELPFDIAMEIDELLDQVKHFDQKKYSTKLLDFKNKYEVYESGHASRDLGERILKEIRS